MAGRLPPIVSSVNMGNAFHSTERSNREQNMPEKSYLTVDEFCKMWKTECLPSIQQEVKFEIETLSVNIKILTNQCR